MSYGTRSIAAPQRGRSIRSATEAAHASAGAIAGDAAEMLARYVAGAEAALAAVERGDVEALSLALDTRDAAAERFPALVARLAATAATSNDDGFAARFMAPLAAAGERAASADARLLAAATRVHAEIGQLLERRAPRAGFPAAAYEARSGEGRLDVRL